MRKHGQNDKGEIPIKTLKFEYKDAQGARDIKEVKPSSIRYDLSQQSGEKEWLLEGRETTSEEYETFVLKNIERCVDEHVQRFLCVTIYVKNEEGKFLLLHHKKLNKWLPPGGKVDKHETPDEAAIRETYEETGVRVQLVGDKPEIEGGLVTPFGSQCAVQYNYTWRARSH